MCFSCFCNKNISSYRALTFELFLNGLSILWPDTMSGGEIHPLPDLLEGLTMAANTSVEDVSELEASLNQLVGFVHDQLT